jgi:N-acetyl-gamma-glutamyl-phosphate reductase
VPVTFTPHVIPLTRGLHATVTATAKGPMLTNEELTELYAKRYADHPFTRVVPWEPDTKHVTRTNGCHVRPHATAHGVYVITSAIDNLVKGGAGQAVQNLNLMFNQPEATGLPVIGGAP